MTPTKILIGQIVIVFSIVIAGIWFATQWTAARLAYQPELGVPWAIIGRVRVYRPWSLFGWWFHFDAYAPSIFSRAGEIAATSGFLGCGAAVAGSLWRARQRRSVTTYGSAHWASRRDVQAAGLLGEGGIFLGRLNERYLRHDGSEHILAFAPTRSGKGVGLVVPTLLGWSGSAVVHDIKGENWQLTAGWRSRFSHCLLFNPTDARSAMAVSDKPGVDRPDPRRALISRPPARRRNRRSGWPQRSNRRSTGFLMSIARVPRRSVQFESGAGLSQRVAATAQVLPSNTNATLYRARVAATYILVADFSTCMRLPVASQEAAFPCG